MNEAAIKINPGAIAADALDAIGRRSRDIAIFDALSRAPVRYRAMVSKAPMEEIKLICDLMFRDGVTPELVLMSPAMDAMLRRTSDIDFAIYADGKRTFAGLDWRVSTVMSGLGTEAEECCILGAGAITATRSKRETFTVTVDGRGDLHEKAFDIPDTIDGSKAAYLINDASWVTK